MNDIHKAQPEDVYVDAQGKLWRVVSICGEPTVLLTEIEPETRNDSVQMHGGMSGLMWDGFKRIYTPEKKDAWGL
ncbi:hypothetical protein LCGC14_0836840 [marine sediment metagenome]|uniref:Uncharacterized protein n=1 Tax=marine sediment metagenome TaxID=412755 RepID=A0A0F9PEB2_9ZZZZ